MDLYIIFDKFKYLYSKTLPNIEYKRKIYVKKELPPINKELIGKLLNFMKGEILNEVNKNEINYNNNGLPLMFKDKIIDKKKGTM